MLTFSPFRNTSSLPWAAGLAVLMVLLQATPEALQQQLRYEREAVMAGQWWRLVSGNLVHLGWAHLALNGVALLIGAWLFAAARTPLAWAAALLACALVVNLGLLWLSPAVWWCVGLSGVLHGFLLIGACDWVRSGERIGWLLVAAWTGKVLWEQRQGAVPMSEGLVGGAVITDAHLYGLLGGLLFVLLEGGWRCWRQRV
jgi:rhomboid family GlyGly-CTERM serine protease